MTGCRADSDDSREEWDRLWSGRTERELRPPYKLGVRLDRRFGELVDVTISEAPAEVVDRLYFESATCPICGRPTSVASRLPASLNLTFANGIQVGQCVWAHPDCFERCPDTGLPAGIPW
jgi:hypothetical protein